MKRVVGLLFLLTPSLVLAAEAPASDQSVRQLIEVMQVRKLLDDMTPHGDAMYQAIAHALGEQTLSEKEKAVVDEMQRKIAAVFEQEMRWESLEPQLVSLYKETFTEEEIAGMLKFYRSEAGQAVIEKMPLVMQGSMKMVRVQMQRVMPKIQQIEHEAIQQLKECCQSGS